MFTNARYLKGDDDMNCSFEIEGKIKGKGRPRFSKFGNFVKAYTPADTASYENLIKLQFRIDCGSSKRTVAEYFGMPVSVHIGFRDIPWSGSILRSV